MPGKPSLLVAIAGLTISCLMIASSGPAHAVTCANLRTAYENLLSGSFTAERHLTIIMNKELKAREITRLDYADRHLETEILERELLDKNIVLEESATDAAIAVSFDCDLFEDLGKDRYRVRTRDEKKAMEELEFLLDRERTVLVPTVWRNREQTRFLWKKLVIEAEALYKDFEWREPAAGERAR